MINASDSELLAQFARTDSEAAFAILVQRYIGLVHSVALRHTTNPQQAQDITQITNGSPYLGKHVRLTCWLRTSEVQGSATPYLVIKANDKRIVVRDDNLEGFKMLGTTDWQQIEKVTDIPNEPCVIYLGSYLKGAGEIWADDFQLAIAPSNQAITDDRAWHYSSCDPDTYSKTIDFLNKHDGHTPVCLTYTPDHAAPEGSWSWWGQIIRPPELDKYRGHTVRMTGWVKTENLSGRLQPAIRPWNKNAKGWKVIARDSMADDYSLSGTRDWTQFTVTCDIPKTAQHIEMSLVFWGSGKVWIDKESLKYKIIK